MIKKVLIANRGEIATRIIRTCKEMGIETVAVYSEADKDAPFVMMADESFLLGGPRVNESYLNVDKLLSIAKESQVDAIHPGYGFLSENGMFAEKCEEESIPFIGPTSQVIKQMGSKIAARKIMDKAGVPVVPGTMEAVPTTEEAIEVANKIGYPVMLKASLGGGGIGMQVVHSDDELQQAFEQNAKRAKTFFGDGSMFVEKKVDNARHIEIQILADHHGNVVHLYERECSIQRRNQKVIEEAPSSFITQRTREAMGEAAVKAAKAVNYTNAGTVEFLVDEEENFYFLEMNTRVQVEHPITEEITGIDIVKQQFLIASGKSLAITQDEININGHAIEARIYAEDPITFFPSPGQISKLSVPEGKNIRHELGVTDNYQVTPFYDPMIAKLIVKGKDREEAIQGMSKALENYLVEGIKTNIPMLQTVINHEQFKAGNTQISFVEEFYLTTVKK
ncbi:acetyl-CoA carboxylase biotin carboxylase subunit [Cerasibacillus terrae]|uniref:biotin carboxylase n=1 Tax=Cerasibacillus terrae TaxID=2498845 RepID=A0A5C8P2F4_9BACI|nr:acetyl-CoA carboxylase biotin carboxylase subunit [Cerasibacillus terrae]TXL67790.1 acetyl-CoA carboxylase biotin carboxylase subunit [Cerasibacillus terrae]